MENNKIYRVKIEWLDGEYHTGTIAEWFYADKTSAYAKIEELRSEMKDGLLNGEPVAEYEDEECCYEDEHLTELQEYLRWLSMDKLKELCSAEVIEIMSKKILHPTEIRLINGESCEYYFVKLEPTEITVL